MVQSVTKMGRSFELIPMELLAMNDNTELAGNSYINTLTQTNRRIKWLTDIELNYADCMIKQPVVANTKIIPNNE